MTYPLVDRTVITTTSSTMTDEYLQTSCLFRPMATLLLASPLAPVTRNSCVLNSALPEFSIVVEFGGDYSWSESRQDAVLDAADRLVGPSILPCVPECASVYEGLQSGIVLNVLLRGPVSGRASNHHPSSLIPDGSEAHEMFT